MVKHNMSESEEMYLIVIAQANEMGQHPVPLGHLAAELNVQPVSVNQMIKKLEEAGKVIYTPYKGVELSATGRAAAVRILRHRRLWEVFLTEMLGFSPVEADEIACRLEHVVSDDVVERLYLFLGSPQTSPQGKPIPPSSSTGDMEFELDFSLAMMAAGSQVLVTAIKLGEAEKVFLHQVGVAQGAQMHVLAIQDTGACLVKPHGFPTLQLSFNVAEAVRVRQLKLVS